MNWNDIENLWRSGEWATRRKDEQEWFDLFSAKFLRQAETEKPDPKTGKKSKLYPLEINPLKSMAEAHRDTVIGILPGHNAVPVRISHPTDQITQVLSQIQKDSNFGSMFMEAVLVMQSRGGHAFKVNWEPQRDDLAYRTRIIGINSANIWPIYDVSDPWRLLECYIGYEIDADTAMTMYGIKINGNTGLYMEWWSETEYHVWVDGTTVTINAGGRSVPLTGTHNLGRVPVVYVPHVPAGRDEGIWGTSLAQEIEGIIKEINLSTADIGDAVYEITHQKLIAGNLPSDKLTVQPIVDQDKNITGYYLNTGKSPNAQFSHEPFADFPTHPDLPQTSKDYQDQLWTLASLQTRTAKAALGEINFSSGRVVGTVMSQLMLPTISHTQTERTDLATGLGHVVDIILRTLRAHKADLSGMGVTTPAISDDTLKQEIRVTWYPAIPVEVVEKNQMLVTAYQAGTISLVALLEERGVDDPEAEAERIWGDIERAAMIQAKADAYVQVQAANAQAKAQKDLNDQKLQQNDELHQQKMQQNA